MFYCDIEISRQNIEVHTNIKHPGKPVRERFKRLRDQSSLYVFKSKKANLDTAVFEHSKAQSKAESFTAEDAMIILFLMDQK